MESFGINIFIMSGDDVKMYSIPFTTRMSVVRLASGKLWIHSPVKLTTERRKSVEELGDVAYIVAPNQFHHLFVGDWVEAFPNAQLWGGPGLMKKRPDLRFVGELTGKAQAPWGQEIEVEIFKGSKLLPEAIFFHPASKTLIITDLIQNHRPQDNTWFWRWIKRLNGILAPSGGVPRDLRLAVGEHDGAKASMEKILAWDFEQIILGHGACITSDAKHRVRTSFEWL